MKTRKMTPDVTLEEMLDIGGAAFTTTGTLDVCVADHPVEWEDLEVRLDGALLGTFPTWTKEGGSTWVTIPVGPAEQRTPPAHNPPTAVDDPA